MSHKKSSQKARPNADLAAWCEVLSTKLVGDTIPDGWLTTQQLSEKIGVSLTETRRRANQSLAEGKLKAQKFRIVTNAKTHRVTHYKLIGK